MKTFFITLLILLVACMPLHACHIASAVAVCQPAVAFSFVPVQTVAFTSIPVVTEAFVPRAARRSVAVEEELPPVAVEQVVRQRSAIREVRAIEEAPVVVRRRFFAAPVVAVAPVVPILAVRPFFAVRPFGVAVSPFFGGGFNTFGVSPFGFGFGFGNRVVPFRRGGGERGESAAFERREEAREHPAARPTAPHAATVVHGGHYSHGGGHASTGHVGGTAHGGGRH